MDTSLHLLLLVVILYNFSPSSAQTGICDPVTNNCANGVCQLQTNNQYGCVCNVNHIRNPNNPLVCNLIPPCDPANVQQCINGLCQLQFSGQYGCTCNPGFQVSGINPDRCEDINECALPITACAPGACTDLVGDYACSACQAGFVLNQFSKCDAGNQVLPNQPGSNGGFFPSMFPSFGGGNPYMWMWMMDEMFK
ncbi:unnamed protein product [Lymnaea stagnalis]|uniref:EGF-like domain-containing protein n=1 Tax=Lymnaea stagnalis TaxID=6523 RepID=A0AAV2HBY0_LYMST